MKISKNIRQLYAPIQPTVKQSVEKVVYSEFLPGLELQPYIYCYWTLKTNQELTEPYNYKVVADGCIDIFFEINNPQENFVMGFCKTFTEFPLNKSFHYIGVRFLPTIFPQLFKVNAAELSNRFLNLESVVPRVSSFIANNFTGWPTHNKIKKRFDDFFAQELANADLHSDNRMYSALDIIFKKTGGINIETNLDTGISPRQLRRLFQFYIGDTAKTFAKVVRFQNILRARPSSQSLRQNKSYFDAGYYDQAHFIKEFKNFYGVTPGKAFRN